MKLLVQMLHFLIILSMNVFARIYPYIVQMCSRYVSESFVCPKFYIGADLTDLRKNSNNPISLFFGTIGIISRDSQLIAALP